ncbi:MAG TPA: hypothetical protein DD624_07185 [Alphaproteobacteria bacterium]|nr:hypothetical protein [Alphaproteobacteria bacterium]
MNAENTDNRYRITLYIDTPSPMLKPGLAPFSVSGHAFVGLSDGKAEERWGYTHSDFSDSKLKMLVNVIRGSQGQMNKEDANSPYHEAIVWNVSEAQYKAAQAEIKKQRENPGTYKLFERNCSTVATSVLQAAGIQDIPSGKLSMSPYGWALKKRVMLAKRRMEAAVFKVKNTIKAAFGKKKVPNTKLLASLRAKPVPVSIRQGIKSAQADYRAQETQPLNVKRILMNMAAGR